MTYGWSHFDLGQTASPGGAPLTSHFPSSQVWREQKVKRPKVVP